MAMRTKVDIVDEGGRGDSLSIIFESEMKDREFENVGRPFVYLVVFPRYLLELETKRIKRNARPDNLPLIKQTSTDILCLWYFRADV